MLEGLITSARELRNPLTVGYSALFTAWILVGERLHQAAERDALGRRLLRALESTGSASELALVTFIAALIGSILWHAGVARVVRLLAMRAGHPDWPSFIEQARVAVREYEEYSVITTKGQTGGRLSPFDTSHHVPSPHWGGYLQQRVEERERTASEMSFRVTLAVAMLPVAFALGIEGGARWWWSMLAVPVVWLEVALIKYTTLRTVRRYQTEDLQAQLQRTKDFLESLNHPVDYGGSTAEQRDASEQRRLGEISRTEVEVQDLEQKLAKLNASGATWQARLFAFLEGEPT